MRAPALVALLALRPAAETPPRGGGGGVAEPAEKPDALSLELDEQVSLTGSVMAPASATWADGSADADVCPQFSVANATFCGSVRRLAGAAFLPDCANTTGGVIPLNISGLATILEEARKAEDDVLSLAMFHSEGCPFSRALAPTFVGLASAFPQLFAFQIEGRAGGRLSSRLGIRASPTLVLLRGDVVHRALPERTLWELIARVANATRFTPVEPPGAEPDSAPDSCDDDALIVRLLRDYTSSGSSLLDPPADVFGEPPPPDPVLVLALAFLGGGAVLLFARWVSDPHHPVVPYIERRWQERGGICAGCLFALLGAWRGVARLAAVLDSPPPPFAEPLAAGTRLRVSYGDGFEGRGANWAVRVRSRPTLNHRESRVLGHVRNGETVVATGRTEREFVHVRFQGEKEGWMAMTWEGYTMLVHAEPRQPEPETGRAG